jgi:hypothetical protein
MIEKTRTSDGSQLGMTEAVGTQDGSRISSLVIDLRFWTPGPTLFYNGRLRLASRTALIGI